MKNIYIKTVFFSRFDTERHDGKIDANLFLSTVADVADDEDNDVKFDYLNDIVAAACKHADATGEDRHPMDDSGNLNLNEQLTWAEVYEALRAGKTVGMSHEDACTVFVPMVQGLDETKEQAGARVKLTAGAALHQLEFYNPDEAPAYFEDSDW